MASPAETPVVIEVALNGTTRPEQNPHVPVTSEALAADALRCIEAGASIVHTHAPDITRRGEAAAALYTEHFAPVLERHPEVILYPTLVFAESMDDKTGHLPHLVRTCGLRMGFVDPGSLNLGPTEEGLPVGIVYANAHAELARAFALHEQLALAPGMAIFEPGFLKTALAWHRAGRLPRGAFLRLYLGGDRSYRGGGEVDLLFGLPAETWALDAYLRMLEGVSLPWSVAVLSGDVLERGVARHALERGGHLRVGLEDFAGPRRPSNLELVREAVALCAEVGRPVARPDELAKLLDLPR